MSTTELKLQNRTVRRNGFSLEWLFVCNLIAALCFSGVAHAEELQTGKVYAQGASVSSKMLGLRMRVPKGFKGAISGEYFVMERGKVAIFAVRADKVTLGEAAAFLSSPQDLGAGYVFAPKEKPTKTKNKVVVACTISRSGESWPGEATVVMGPHGVGVGVIATASPEEFARTQRDGRALLRSIKFSKPYVPKPGKSSGPWVQVLRGRQLSQYDTRSGTGSGLSGSVRFTLCEDGTFTRRTSSSGFSYTTGPGAVSVSHAGYSRYHGKWSAVGNKLHLFYADGDRNTYTLSRNEVHNFLMDGNRWLNTPSSCVQ